jgi:diguanylate cyclase (GGDEF)-like protein/PAS domain S-box-containing protein
VALMASCGRLLSQYLDIGYLERPWTPVMTGVLAMSVALRAFPERLKWPRVVASALAIGLLVIALVFLAEGVLSVRVPYLDGALIGDTVDLATLPYGGRPAILTLLVAVVGATSALALGWDSRRAAAISAWSLVLTGSTTVWLLLNVTFPSAFRVEIFLHSTPGATAIASLQVLALVAAAALVRPYRLPLGPFLTTRTWPLVVFGIGVLLLGTTLAQLAYRLAASALANDQQARFVAFVVQGGALVGLIVFTVWYAALQQRRSSTAARLSAATDTFTDVIRGSGVAMTVLDGNGQVQDVNPAYELLLGRSAEEVRGTAWDEFVLQDSRLASSDGEPLPLTSEAPRSANEAAAGRRKYRHRDGNVVWADVMVVPAQNPENADETLTLEQLVDVTGAAAAEQELSFRASHDSVTGLLQREQITRVLEHLLTNESGTSLLVAVIDLDKFKVVNEVYGHTVGDQVLAQIARRLETAATPAGHVGRLGGDEFVVGIPITARNPDRQVRRLVEQVMSSAEADLTVSGYLVRTAASIGASVGTRGSSAELVLRNATAALAQAKREGGRRWQSYDDSFHTRTRDRILLLQQLRTSVSEDVDQFEMWFQPIVTLETLDTFGYEALARWNHPERGVMAAGDWIETAESDLPLIHQISMMAARRAAAFADLLPAGQRVAINISGAHLSSREFPEFSDLVLDLHRRNPGRLDLELTETSLAQLQGPGGTRLVELVDAGLGLWADDFGTGYSTLAHLRDLPLTGLKLDRSFTAALADPASPAYRIADGLAGLADGLGLQTVAEGIETPQQARRVAAAGWLHGQGWLFGRPSTAQHYLPMSARSSRPLQRKRSGE